VATTADVKLGAEISDTDRLADICFGEKITSFRQMLKRYNFHALYTARATSTGKFVFTRQSGDFPFYRGYVGSSGIHSDQLGNPYNRCKMTLMNWVTPAYVGRRGGIRYKTLRHSQIEVNGFNNHSMLVDRVPDATTSYGENTESLTLSDTANFVSSDNLALFPHGLDGLYAQASSQNPVVEYELPYQQMERFLLAKQVNQTSTLFGVQYHKLTAVSYNDNANNSSDLFLDYVCGAEDFSLYFFTGAPICYYAPSDPSA
jgi:hypothetical protein